jgi:hypothetical protein
LGARGLKEKLAGLRFYVKGGSERALARIGEAIHEAEITCEQCCGTGQIRTINDWLTTV